jgi:hypothetical protein
MKDSRQHDRPAWLYHLASISIGIPAGIAAGWLITAAFSITRAPVPDMPSFEDAVQAVQDAVPAKTTASGVTVRAIDPPPPELDQPKLSEPALVAEQPTIVPAPVQVAEIVPLPRSRPRSVPLPRPRP